MKTETIQTPHCVSVLPGVSKNPTHSRHRSHRVFLPLPAFGQQITITFLYFPKQRRKPVPSPKQPTAGRLTTPYGQSSASRRRAVPVPLPAQHLPSALGPRTHQQRQQQRRHGGVPQHGRRVLRVLFGTGSAPREPHGWKWRRPVEGGTSSRGWAECAEQCRAGRGQVVPGPPRPRPARLDRGGSPHPPPHRAPPAGAFGGAKGRGGAVPEFRRGSPSLGFISPPPRKASCSEKEANKATVTSDRCSKELLMGERERE